MKELTLEAIKTHTNTIEIDVEEFSRLKDIETRFTILKNQMMHAEYCPIHTQVILGIEQSFAQKQEIKTDLLPGAWDPLKPSKQRKEIEVPSFMQEGK